MLRLLKYFFFQEKVIETREKVLEEVANYEKANLNVTEVNEKVTLPTSDEISKERLHRELLTDIQDFDAEKLQETTTEETHEPKVLDAVRDRSSSGSSSSSSSSSPQTSSGGSSWEKVEGNNDS